jgi:hypothetical protein
MHFGIGVDIDFREWIRLNERCGAVWVCNCGGWIPALRLWLFLLRWLWLLLLLGC